MPLNLGLRLIGRIGYAIVRSRMRIALLCLLCTATACGSASLGFGVAVTATFDSNVDGDAVARVTQLVIAASGDETYQADVPLGRAAERVERFVYRPRVGSQHLALSITAEDQDGVPVAQGSAEVQLAAGETTFISITLSAAIQPFDASVPLDASAPLDAAQNDDLEGVPTCSQVAAELCEDFEHGYGAAWERSATNATLALATTYAHSGTYAMHVHLNSVQSGDSATAKLIETQTFATAQSAFYARAFVYFPDAPPSTAANFSMVTTQQTVSPYGPMNIEIDNGFYGLYDQFASNQYVPSSSQFPAKTWVCVELAVQIGNPGSLQVLADGTSVEQLTEQTSSTTSVGEIWFGGNLNNSSANASAVVDFWMDDLIVDTKPIGCGD
jgi:hypothetical protein